MTAWQSHSRRVLKRRNVASIQNFNYLKKIFQNHQNVSRTKEMKLPQKIKKTCLSYKDKLTTHQKVWCCEKFCD